MAAVVLFFFSRPLTKNEILVYTTTQLEGNIVISLFSSHSLLSGEVGRSADSLGYVLCIQPRAIYQSMKAALWDALSCCSCQCLWITHTRITHLCRCQLFNPWVFLVLSFVFLKDYYNRRG